MSLRRTFELYLELVEKHNRGFSPVLALAATETVETVKQIARRGEHGAKATVRMRDKIKQFPEGLPIGSKIV